MPVPVDLPEPPRTCLHAAVRDGDRPEGPLSMVSARHPLRVHHDEDHTARAAATLAALELAWDVQVDALGFQPPVLPDDADGPELDVYLRPVGEGQAWVQPALAEIDAVPGDGRMSTAVYIVIDHDLPDALVDSYAVHEFNHALQFATDFTETSLTFWEATAVASQEWTLGPAGKWPADVRFYQEAPWASALTADSYTLWRRERVGWLYEYGAGLWMISLDRRHGTGDGRLGAVLWDTAANEGRGREPDLVDAVATVTGDDVGVFLSELAADRWRTGDRWDPAGLAEAEHFGPHAAVPHVDVTAPATLTFDHGPHTLGQAFVVVRGSGALEARVTSDEGLRAAILALTATEEIVAIDAPVAFTGDAVLAVTNLGPPGWDGDDDPYVPGDLVLDVYPAGEAPRACGCASTRGAGWLAVILAAALARRRS